jgi:ankyrin repeat protein
LFSGRAEPNIRDLFFDGLAAWPRGGEDVLWQEPRRCKVKKQIVVAVVLAVLLAVSAYAQTTDFIKLVETGTPQDVQAAISKGADVNAPMDCCYTPLIYAAKFNPNPEVLTTLLKAGADIEARDKAFQGMTALMWAAEFNENPDVITTLLKAGADLKVQDKAYGATALMLAARRNRPEMITALLKAGADFEARSKDGMTALMFAVAYNQNPEVISTLLDAGVDAKAKDGRGKTAFDYAQGRAKLKDTDAYRQLQEASQ